MKKVLVLGIFILLGFTNCISAQKIYIAEQYDFMNEPNQHGLPTLIRMYMDRYNYPSVVVAKTNQNTVMQHLSPDDYAVQIQYKSNMFITRIKIELINYNGEVVLTSPEGNSRDKDTRHANVTSLRMAMDNFSELKNHSLPHLNATENKIAPTASDFQVIRDEKVSPEKETVTLGKYLDARKLSEQAVGLYEQQGLVPKMVLYKTSSRDCFLVTQNDTPKGVFLYRNQQWYWEFYEENQLRVIPQFVSGL